MQETEDKMINLTDVVSNDGSSVSTKLARNDLKNKQAMIKEIDGPKGLEPTRYGDWESKGRCHDF